MSTHAYSEDQLVEQPAIGLFATLGWQTVSAMEETFGAGGTLVSTLGRETKGEVVLVERLKAALGKFNCKLPPEAIQTAIDELTRDRSAMSLEAANREVYRLLKEGITVSVPDREHGGQKTERLRVVDWEHPENNDFLLVSQFSVTGALYTCRPDLVGFVNGLPWVVIELKKPGVPARAAFDENLTHYKQQIPALFWSNALLIASNGTDSRVGSLTADWGRWVEWKRIEREDEPRRVSLEVMLRGTCDPVRLLDLAENFTLFSEHKAGLVKIIGQNHQFLGVNNAIASMLEARTLGHGRGGVFWQTQGSGKSFAMVFFAQKVLRKLAGNWTFVVVTDRVELDEQIAKTFKTTGAVSEAEGDQCHAASGAHLRELLRGNHRYVFTLVHKFQTPELLCDRSDVIVLTDEAHRSQYDTLALNMRAALPKAMFLAFTGTPLIAGEERTKEVFGDYVSIYDFQQSVEDGATVPLFYENRTPELQLVNPDLNEDIYRLIEDAELDADQEAKLERVLGRQYHLITRDDRLETVAQDIVRHFLGRGFVGKAMVVSIDKATALRMHDKVKVYWAAETARVQQELGELHYQPGGSMSPEQARRDARVAELKQRLDVLTTTDMAVIVSPGQNEIQQMQALGLDIEPHRKRMNDSQPGLDEKFKDTDDPLRLVFVCAMWLTGFDAPSCSTVYLDKPMRNHSLMQTIARANRVFPGKHSGVIVDYANVFASLEKALAIYGAGKDGKSPVKDKQQLVEELRRAVADATAFCVAHGVLLAEIEQLAAGSLERLQGIEDAMNALISPDPLRRDFLGHERLVSTLYRAVKPDPSAIEFASRVACLTTLAEAIRAKLNPNPPDISQVMGQINNLLDESITGHAIRQAGPPALDLSKINFEALAQRFKESKRKNTEIEVLKAAIRAQLEKMIQLNRTRADFAEKFEALIESYNAGSRSIEELFEELVKLSNSLNDEQERHVRENMSEEELVIFDILTRPAPELSADERAEVKKAASELLARLKNLLVLNWRQKSSARSQLKLAIEDTLDSGLPRAYTPELYNQKCSAVFEHVYESYPERNAGVYA
ncbi:MAG: type I restriction endonuclease subunit R [Gammaproteobacteria bacterium]|nr:type I restriction endonuclease subunit R [Rhodocyclaceae bacterium]MBU3909614.1 type I restriction endonuclease subunit R [Gammaproteobacteria bacterium]MBU3989676.1 type I restriction endonuclease subunit R [Gammaproteobacteria bacterium]MBU4005147.1 type I restriction endonuclease subunit R [Gammaproteobacteria bacterium]MBU4022326.1 type I restriction endonuclease subunit R [Gammaproteobacteria bacterium]